MRIDVIDTRAALEQAREQWNAVYAADPEAQFFLSWTWIANWLDTAKSHWFVLVAKPEDGSHRPVGFLPIRFWMTGGTSGPRREFAMAGNRLADYTGFLCRPEHAEAAIIAFADHLKALDWATMNLENIRASAGRLATFADRLAANCAIEHVGQIDPVDGTDQHVCPMIPLPTSWDEYLATRLSANMRQKLRRLLRQVEAADGPFRITHADADTLERDLDILLRFWERKWRARKGKRTDRLLAVNRAMMRRCFAAGSLFLPILWRDNVPLGALASFVDPIKGTLLFYMGARDEAVDNPPPGLVLHAFSIRYAIESGFETYDFLRGNEPYKYLFGPVERRLVHLVVRRQMAHDEALLASASEQFRNATAHHQARRLIEAERLYREILNASPRHRGALYGLGQLLAARGDYGPAEQFFCVLVSNAPEMHKAWLRLAACYRARGKLLAAIDAFRAALSRKADYAEAHYGLGQTLYQIGRSEEAIAELTTAHALDPTLLEAEISLGNLAEASGRLQRSDRPHYARLNVALADRQRRAGAIDSATDLYRRALALDPKLADARRGLELISRIQKELTDALPGSRRKGGAETRHISAA